MTRTIVTGLCASTVIFTQATSAEEVMDLGSIIISGGLTPIEAENYGRSVSVLTAEDIEARGIKTVQNALRQLPGVSVTSTGASYTTASIRGGDSNHFVLLVDGVDMTNVNGGPVPFRGIAVQNIERIEVLRGPQSALYGSNAMTGVISITTKRADAPGTSYGGSVEVGSNRTLNSNLFIRQQGARGDLSFAVTRNKTDGEDGSRYDGGDTEGLESLTIDLSGRYDVTDSVTAGFTFRNEQQDYDSEDAKPFFAPPLASPLFYLEESPQNGERDVTIGSLWVELGNEDERVKHRVSFSGSEVREVSRDSLYFADFNSKGTDVSLQYTGSLALDGASLAATNHRLNFVAEAQELTYASSFNPGGSYTRETQSLAMEYRAVLGSGFDLQLGLRHDFNDVFKDATTWNASLSYQIPETDVRLRGAIGSAVVNPTMTELYGFVPGTYSGNPNLKPEESQAIEIGADVGLGGTGMLSVTAFWSEVTDTIAGSGTTSVNLPGTSKIDGVEIEASVEPVAGLSLIGGYTYLDARDSTGARLQGRPEHEVTLSAVADAFGGRGTVGLGLRHVSGSVAQQFFAGSGVAIPAPLAELPSFTTVDISADYRISDGVKVNARMTNLTDETYQEAWGYYGNGREVFVGLSAEW
jgi:vitamin B12 transporter